jgi:serine/threonine-protein kinase RsbW
VDIDVRLSLPRDAISVPVIRRVLRVALVTLAVHPDCISDIEIALTEACTNVLDHAQAGDSYEVTVQVRDNRCVIDVTDSGAGFDANLLGRSNADLGAEEGRGIQLIRALVDNVNFTPVGGRGRVHLEKSLIALDGSPLRTPAPPVTTVDVGAAENVVALHGDRRNTGT